MDIGKIKKLGEAEIRRLWPNEARDFSPWLANNISILNDILNIRIEIEEIEGAVDDFRLDLSGIDGVSQRPVVIECQYGKSDHDHLGKVITYSASREAGIMIWIANKIQTAHKQAIEWLNKISPQDMAFYAIELEVIKIDDSKPAPDFKIVAGPPPAKRREIVSMEEVTPRNRQYQQFFDRLKTRINELEPNFTRAKGLPQSWWGVGLGKTGFSMVASFTIAGTFRIEVYIDAGSKEENENALLQLKEHRLSIEEHIGCELEWDILSDNRMSRISTSISGSIDEDEKKLQELIDWGTSMIIQFRKVFTPLIRNIGIGLA